MNCQIASQIASNCTDEEDECVCGSIMTFGDTAETNTILYCDNESCQIQLETDNSWY